MEKLSCCSRWCEKGVRREGNRAGSLGTEPCEAHLLKSWCEVADVVIQDLEVIQARSGAIEVPCLNRDVELLDLLPPARSGRHTAKPWDMAEVVERRRVHLGQRELGESV